MDGGSSHVGLRNCDISPQFIVHVRKNGDVLGLPHSGVRLNRKPILNPNVLFVNNGGCVHGGDGGISNEADYQQS